MIDKITKEQEAEIPNFVEKFIKKASSPIDRTSLKELSKKIWGEEKIVIVGESMQNTIDLIKYATKNKKPEYKSSQLRSQLYSQISSQLQSQLQSQLHSQLSSQLSSQLYSQISSQLQSQLRSQLYSQLSSQLSSQLDSQLDSQLGNSRITWDYLVSLWWIVYLGYYDYAKFIGVAFNEEALSLMNRIIDTFSISIFIGNVVFVCERPQVLWDNGMLSNDQKPSISWQDGTGFYYLDGVHFEKELWQRVVSKEMSLSEIMKIEISDQRTVALKYNPQAIIKEKAQLIHKDKRNNELYLVTNSEINTLTNFPKMYFLKMTCPTGRIFIEGVDPDFANKHPNATECQAELCGLTKSEYLSMQMES